MSCAVGESCFGFCSWGVDRTCLQWRMCLVRRGRDCGSCAGGRVSFLQRTRRSGGVEAMAG